MNEHVRNNQQFDSAKEFRQKINYFLNAIIPIIGASLNSRINDNFQIINPAFRMVMGIYSNYARFCGGGVMTVNFPKYIYKVLDLFIKPVVYILISKYFP